MPNTDCRPTDRRGFTLVEVMISIAIALLLIVGVSQIFSIAQRTTGGGMSVIAAAENVRGAQSLLTNDFNTIADGVNDSPGLVIASYSVAAWRNRADQQQDADAKKLTFNDYTTTLDATSVNSRVHRIDRVCFFARDRFNRQTADAPALVSPTSSNEAFIWLGHLALPDNKTVAGWTGPTSGTYWNPGDSTGTNDNNLYASDWILGREVILLSLKPTEKGYYTGGNPLSLTVPATSTDGIPLYASRYDLAQASIAAYRAAIGNSTTWWQDFSGVIAGNGAAPSTDRRYEANPFVTKPPSANLNWTSAAAAQTTPLFVRGCSQFVVEFAGDYCKQDVTTGQITSAGQDGQIDYVVDPKTGARQIRWYGFRRDVNDDGAIDYQHDVMPVSDVLSKAGVAPLTNSFERALPGSYSLSETGSSQAYVCAWGPDTDAAFPRPKMIRITMAIDDPSGHLNTEQTYVYVFNLP